MQRKIGFEMEYSIPLSSTRFADLDFLAQDPPDAASGRRMATYLTGGPVYGNDQSFVAGDGYKVHVDHELELQKAHVELYQRLHHDGMVRDWRRGDHHNIAIPEYVTAAFNEMGWGSTQTIRDTLGNVSAHMTSAWNVAGGGMGHFPNAAGFFVGVPSDDFRDYYAKHYLGTGPLNPILNRIEAAVQDRIAPQATVGILPSSIFKAHQKLLTEDRMTKDDTDPAYPGTRALELAIDYTVDVMEELVHDEDFAALKQDRPVVWDELKGLITLAATYIVGEAYYRSTGFEDYKAVKSAVPLMSKIHLNTALLSAPGLQRFLNPERVGKIKGEIGRHPYADPAKVRTALGVGERTHKQSGAALGPNSTMLQGASVDDLLAGLFEGRQLDHRGQRFADADVMIRALRNASDSQSGIPLEYRRLQIRPNAAGVVNGLWPLVAEARELNMRHMTDEQQVNTMWWADRSTSQVARHYGVQALQQARASLGWARWLLPV